MIKPEIDSNDLDIDTASAMTPMIDVIFTLIAFMMLMINAPLLSIELDLPEAKEPKVMAIKEVKSINLAVFQETGKWQIGEREFLSEKTLKMQLEQLNTNTEGGVNIILTIDKNTHVQRLIDTISILNELNITGTQIAINKTESR